MFDYTDTDLQAIEKYMSSDRMAGYYNYARGDKWIAVRLYERNTRISEALYGVIQALEITLRNAMHRVLTRHLGSATWYETIPLQDSERESVEEAKQTVQGDCPGLVPALIPGKVVAELSFAFWVRLLSFNYEETLWKPYLVRIFPLKLHEQRNAVYVRLKDLKTLRNRIAHHERITCGKRDPERDYASIVETIGWISPTIKNWVESTTCFHDRIKEGIPKRPKTPESTMAAAVPIPEN